MISEIPADFDPIWYAKTYPDVTQIGMDPADHYIWIGKRLGRRPNSGQGAAIQTSGAAPLSEKPSPAPSSAPVSLPGLSPSADGDLPSMPQDSARWARGAVRIARQRAVPLAPLFRSFNPDAMNLHWIVSGDLPLDARQTRIFALIRQLELQGHKQWVWIQPPCAPNGEAALRDALTVQRLLGPRTILRVLPEDIVGISGDAVIATDIWSCFPAAAMPLFKARFRLVQRLDGDGQSDGSSLAFAAHADGLDLMALCAGPALGDAIARSGAWVRSWPPFADDNSFFPAPAPISRQLEEPLRLAVDLGRAGTADVAAELALDTLELLAQRGLPFTAHLFGQDQDFAQLSFAYVSHGLLEPMARGDLFRSCHAGLALATSLDSATQSEMLACGLETIGLIHSSLAPADGRLHLTSAFSTEIADRIEAVAGRSTSGTGIRPSGGANMDMAVQALEAALRDGLSVHNEPVTIARALMSASYEHKAAVIIPTWNGGGLFKDVLEALVTQVAPWSFDVMVVDSGSIDETLDIVRSYEQRGVRLHTIPNSEFQHGRTRNLAISLTSAEFVAVLTQDATPANAHWLANLVKAFDKGTQVAGVFGAHQAYPEATPFVSIGIEGHFEHFNRLPHVADWNRDHGDPIPFGSVPWQNWIHYYSDNNSCMRRSVWEKIPYPNIDWGEDQVWAWEIIKQGYEKAYAHDAIVYHSHNLTIEQQIKVSKIEGEFWLRHFNYRFESSADQVHASADYLQDRNMEFALAHGIDNKIRDEQIKLDRVGVAARYAGQTQLLRDIYGINN